MSKHEDFSGKKFNRLLITKEIPIKNKHHRVECVCDCGKLVNADKWAVVLGHTKSCGCYNADRIKKHGESKTKLYSKWEGMVQRCHNKNSSVFFRYGGKGILVCDEWREYKNFSKWAMENGYEDGLQIDRIDCEKGYNPQNCRFVSNMQNSWNKKPKTNTTGVRFVKRVNRFYARIFNNGKEISLGGYKTEQEAREAYNKKCKELRGIFSQFNEV
jgi:hypothetical protein